MKTAVVVVTYNRPEKLEKSIRAIYGGESIPEILVVVNNCSTDHTNVLLDGLEKEFKSLKTIKTKKNIGGAGGFFVGLKSAYDLGATHFWIMDDDAYAQSKSLAVLLSTFELMSAKDKIGFLCSRVDWVDGQVCEMNMPETAAEWLKGYTEALPVIKVKACSFVSCFFSREILEEVGLPIKEFFIWFDDHEFTHRISRRYPSFVVLNSQVTHDLKKNQGVSFSSVDEGNIWKFKYGAKNESWFRFWRQSPVHWLLYAAQRNRDMYKGQVEWRHRLLLNLKMLAGVMTPFRAARVQAVDIKGLIE